MPKATITETISADTHSVFATVHDYERRLQWDTLLQKAFIEGGGPAGKSKVAVCKSKTWMLGIEMRTVYVSFQPGKVAAVKMVNRPPFFDSFAASIRHFDTGENVSEVVYEYNFTARPRALASLLHPIMSFFLKWETRRRLRSLREYMASAKSAIIGQV